MTPEEKYRYKINKVLLEYFYLDDEVWSDCGTKRIDYALKCKKSGIIFGLEVKKQEHLRGVELGNYLLQASNYSELKFNTIFSKEPIRLMIFISPAISNVICEIKPESKIVIQRKEYFELYHKYKDKHSNVNSFIGCFNVEEIRSTESYKVNYFYFLFKNHIIWSYRDGFRENNYKRFMK